MHTNNKFSKFLRFSFTFTLTALAVFLAFLLWQNYMNGTWTRDGRVRADTVMIAPDASGTISDIYVKDNQFVHKGDLLFKIDDERFKHDLKAALSFSATKKIEYEIKKHKASRRVSLGHKIIAEEELDDSLLAAKLAKAQYEESLVQVEIEKLNLQRTNVTTPCDGWICNLVLKKGDFIQTGESRLAILQSDSFWVYGYFEEHKISKIHINDKVIMNPLGTNYKIKGHVQGIASGITDRDNFMGDRLLANVNPTFTWVRLAQRIPVRIHIDEVPGGLRLVAGMTCSVSVSSTQ